MGNVNGREEDEVEEEEEEGGELEEIPKPIDDEEANTCSVPSTTSPPMFTSQVPVLPLEKQDDVPIPSYSSGQMVAGDEEMYDEQGIPFLVTWTFGGQKVAVEGSWDNWSTRVPLEISGKDFAVMKVLPSGVYQYRFIVDGEPRYAPNLPCVEDGAGNICNLVDLEEYVPEDLASISSFEPPLSPVSSYDNVQLGNEDFAKEPPVLPPHLQMTLLNVPSCDMEVPTCLSRPQHVVLNHLYMQKGKGGPPVVALGSTNRFLAKYVSVVLYKSLQR